MPFAELYKNIFEKEGPNPESPALLRELVKEYPYFSLAHFFLLQQTPVTDEDYEKVAARTALHFNNPYFLQSQLREASLKQTNIEILDEDSAASPAIVPEIKTGEEPVARLTDSLIENDTSVEEISTVKSDEVNNGQLQEVYTNNDAEPTARVEDITPVEITSEPETGNREHDEEVTVEPEEKEISEVVSAIGSSPEEEKTTEENEIKYVPINLPEELLPEVKDAWEEIDASVSEAEVETNIEDEEVVHKPSVINTDNLTELKTPVPHQKHQADAPMIFEPLHASDYFASQGIKLREEAQPADKLGKQLKSFTEWLKTMKKVHEPGNENGSANIDLSVQTLAEKSNKEEEILTEAMAEVFMQQGKGNKAREIYQKLSLLNPAKSSYFAAKIDQIK